VTLAERDFLYGAAVLLNSLVRNQFSGRFIIGVRPDARLPKDVVEALERAHITGVEVELRRIDTTYHFTNYKAEFLLEVSQQFSNCLKLTYMDPDIVVCCPFEWIDTWSDGGPAVCGDVNWMMPADHPTRREWLAISGLSAQRRLDVFFNGGFLSVRREDLGFVKLWSDLIEKFGGRDNSLEGKGDIADWRHGGRWLPFFSPNQDTLNLAAMTWAGRLTTLGPDVMGFLGLGLLPHAVGADKPWRKNYLTQALAGRPPTQADKAFWDYARTPVPVVSRSKATVRQLALQAASFIGRFYCRP